jgi:uncharacterized protein (DUF58 family)
VDAKAAEKRIRRLLSGSDILSRAMLSGSYRSAFRGRGSEFRDLRPYDPMDDARSIDWNVSARSSAPFVKLYSEERELPVLILLDNSSSMDALAPGRPCRESAAAVAALVAWAADLNGDRASLWTYDRGVRSRLPEGRGRGHRLSVLRALARPPEPGDASLLDEALEEARARLTRRSLVVAVSDFLSGFDPRAHRALASANDIVMVRIVHAPLSSGRGRRFDPGRMPAAGSFTARDPETGRSLFLDFSDPGFRARYEEWSRSISESFARDCVACGARSLEIRAGDDPLPALTQFFKTRFRRKR